MADPRRIDWPVEQMRKWYEEDNLSLQMIADRLGQNVKTVNKAAKRFGFRMKRPGHVDYPRERHPAWKGGKVVDKRGYILVHLPEHPLASKGGYVREHRLVAEAVLGRYLTPTEVVHHKDDDPANNHPDNLVVYETNGQHLAETLAGKCPNWSEDGKKRIVAAVVRIRAKEASLRLSKPGDQGLPKTPARSTE